ncbi:helix-turn-helix domain-containing protein [Actinomadura adrarensis]|uniref:Helix-turn-helix domain-containing protein n=1 Tax=Actinomadura adrarensis TaxID=1819600 RepID=A0ABW3CB98_9ACTN
MPRTPRDPGVPQSPADYFGAELRAYREAAELSRPQLAERLGYSPQWIGQIEQGTSAPSEDFAKDCDTYFGTNGSFYRIWEWIKLSGQLQLLPPGFPEFLRREEKAVVMYIFEAMTVTGLFQTHDYAYEVLKAGRSKEEIEDLVGTRLDRQKILTGTNPPRVVVIFDEGALRRPVGGPEVMRGQIRHLIELAELPNVTLQIVPLNKGAYPGVMGAFTLITSDDEPDMVYIEGHVGGQLLSHTVTVREYGLRFDLIRGVAISTDDSLDLLHTILESL